MSTTAEKSIVTALAPRVPGRPWKKGESGNPGGRPRQLEGLREAARMLAPAALDTLNTLMSDENMPAAVRVTAACAILDRGYGRPSVQIELDDRRVDDGMLDEIRRISEATRAQFDEARRLGAGPKIDVKPEVVPS